MATIILSLGLGMQLADIYVNGGTYTMLTSFAYLVAGVGLGGMWFGR